MFMRKSKALVVMLTAAMLLVGALELRPAGDSERSDQDGFAVPMSGTATSLAPDAGINAQIAVEYINKYEGGILGRPVQAFIYDTKGDPQTTVDVFGKLIENDGVEAVLGCLSSSTGLAIAPRVENRWKIPTLLLEATTMQMFTYRGAKPQVCIQDWPR